MRQRRVSYFERFSISDTARLDDIVALQRGVIGRQIHLIASACYPFDSVLRALAEPSFVLPAEGMPGARYLPGAAVMDMVESDGEELVLALFGQPDGYRVSMQPHSGTQANQIVYNAVLEPDDTVLSLGPRDGGHISHTVLLSRRHSTVHYSLADDGTLDYDDLRAKALAHRPRLIIVGGSSLPRSIDFGLCKEIALETGALLHGDISHTATFVAAGAHPNAFPHCDFVTFNTVKNLRGPNSGVLVYRSDYASRVHEAIFPVTQGGANESGMLAKLACFVEWGERDIADYAMGIVRRARVVGAQLKARGVRLVSGGTDSHLLLLDLREGPLSGAEVERKLEAQGVLANRNLVPGDRRSPQETSGLRIGAANLAILGYEVADLELLADLIAESLNGDGGRTDVVEYLVDRYQRHLVSPVW